MPKWHLTLYYGDHARQDVIPLSPGTVFRLTPLVTLEMHVLEWPLGIVVVIYCGSGRKQPSSFPQLSREIRFLFPPVMPWQCNIGENV